MPSCKGLSLPTRPIAPANSSKISEVWLPESSKANVFTLTPLAVATAMGTICSRTAEGEQFTDEAPTKTGATAFKVETGDALFKGGGATKPVPRRGLAGGGICYSLPHHIVSCASSHVLGGLLTRSRKSTTSFPCLTELSDSHPSL